MPSTLSNAWLVVRGKPGALTGIEVLRVPTREPLDESAEQSADELASADRALPV